MTIARRSAAGVDGVEVRSRGIGRLMGRKSPSATTKTAGGHAFVDMNVALAWPTPASDTAAAVRDAVRTHLSALTGLPVRRVDVHVSAVPMPTERPVHDRDREHEHDANAPVGDARVGSLPPARPPVAVPAAAGSAIMIGLLLLAAVVLVVQNAVVHAGWVPEPSWAGTLASRVNGARPQWWWNIVGAVAALAGIALVVGALKPRRRTSIRVPHHDDTAGGVLTSTSMWIRPVDVARFAGDAAAAADSVTHVTTKATRKKLVVTAATVDQDVDAARDRITEAVTARLAPVADELKIRVRVRTNRQAP